MRNEDDEIQILGSAETPLKKDSGKNRRVWIAAWTAVFILACVCLFFFLPSQQAFCCRPTAACNLISAAQKDWKRNKANQEFISRLI